MKKFIIGLVIVLCALWVLNCKLTERLIVTSIEAEDSTAVVEVIDNGMFTGVFKLAVYNDYISYRQSMNLFTHKSTIVASLNSDRFVTATSFR